MSTPSLSSFANSDNDNGKKSRIAPLKSLAKDILTRAQAPLRNVFQIGAYLIKPVYDVASYGEDFSLPFDQDLLTATEITFTSATFARESESIGGRTLFPADPHTTAFTDQTTGALLNEGDDTAYARDFVWLPDMDAVIYKLGINMAFGLICSAFSSGTLSLTSVRIRIFEIGNNNSETNLFDHTFRSGLGNLTGTGTQVFIIDHDQLTDIEVFSGRPIVFEITLTTTVSGTNTRQEGLIEWFPYQAAAVPKSFSVSELSFHIHAAVSHADKALRRQRNEEKLDYGGMTVHAMTNKEHLDILSRQDSEVTQ